MNIRFAEKVVIITGAAGDIGSAAVKRFASEGAAVVAVDMNETALQSLVAACESQGHSIISVVADVTQEDGVKRYVETAVNAHGSIDVLFNNAGIEGDCCCISEYDTAIFDRVMAVNVKAAFLGMKHVVPIMQGHGGGSIINAASVAGLSGAPGFSAYTASKHAVIGLTRSVAKQQGIHNIRVNAVCPSAVDGNMMNAVEQKMQPDSEDTQELRKALQATVPLQRYAKPSDVVSIVAYLSSDEASFINGGVYTVDGGVTA